MNFQFSNRTGLADDWLRQVVVLATPAGLANFSIEFLPDRWHHGFAYPERRGARVWLAESAYPLRVGETKRVRLTGLEEVAIFLTAHELLHLWQAEHGRAIDARYPEIRLFCERDANAYAARMLRRYRGRRAAIA